jgi:hypothetical protein
MPSQFTSTADASPDSIKSGGKTTVSVSYESMVMTTLRLSSSPAFSISPTQKSLPPSTNGIARVEITVKRIAPDAPSTCLVILNAFSDERTCSLEVDP